MMAKVALLIAAIGCCSPLAADDALEVVRGIPEFDGYVYRLIPQGEHHLVWYSGGRQAKCWRMGSYNWDTKVPQQFITNGPPGISNEAGKVLRDSYLEYAEMVDVVDRTTLIINVECDPDLISEKSSVLHEKPLTSKVILVGLQDNGEHRIGIIPSKAGEVVRAIRWLPESKTVLLERGPGVFGGNSRMELRESDATMSAIRLPDMMTVPVAGDVKLREWYRLYKQSRPLFTPDGKQWQIKAGQSTINLHHDGSGPDVFVSADNVIIIGYGKSFRFVSADGVIDVTLSSFRAVDYDINTRYVIGQNASQSGDTQDSLAEVPIGNERCRDGCYLKAFGQIGVVT